MAIEYLPVSWTEYHALAQQLAEKLLTAGKTVDEIVAISRGGLTLGHLLTDFLRVPISTFTVQSYTDLMRRGRVRITKPLSTPIYDKRILLVDDVSDSGKTLVRALKYLRTQQPKKVITMTMYYKPQSMYKPDFFAGTTPAWIIFPYEQTESIINIYKMLKKEHKSEAEIAETLKSLKFSPSLIAFTKKHYLQ